MHLVLMIVACGFGCSVAGSARASLLTAALAAVGFWLAAAVVGHQLPGATLTVSERAFCAYAGPLAAIVFPILAGIGAGLERRRRATLRIPAWLLAGTGLVNGFVLGLSLWGFAPYEDGGLFAGVIGVALAAVGTGAAAVLLRCVPPGEMRTNVVALLFGVISVTLGAVAFGDARTTIAVRDHSYRGW
jgi:hypothetical protein